jgi:hypothetical protein
MRETTKELLAVARDGEGGGYIGFGFAYVLPISQARLRERSLLWPFFVGMIAVKYVHTFEKCMRFGKSESEGETDEEGATEKHRSFFLHHWPRRC